MRKNTPVALLASGAVALATVPMLALAPAASATQSASTPTRLSAVADDALGDESVVTDDAGTVRSVFTVKRDGLTSVLSARRAVGGAWTSAEVVHGRVSRPDIAVGGDGFVVIVWQKSVLPTVDDPGHAEIWCTRYNADLSDAHTGQISNPEHNATNPQVVVDDAGRATIMWFDDDRDPVTPTQFDHNPHAFYVTRDVANPGSAGQDLCDFGGSDLGTASTNSEANEPYPPLLAVDGQGNVSAAWNEIDDNVANPVRTIVRARQQAGTGTFSTTTLTSATSPDAVTAVDLVASDVGSGAPGDVSLAYLSDIGGSRKAAITVRPGTGPDAGTWSAAEFPASGSGTGVSVWQAGPTGGTTAAVVTGSGTKAIEVVDRDESSSTWGASTTISATGDNTQPDGGAASDGSATVTWLAGSTVTSRHRTPSGTWEDIVPVSTGSGADYPQIGVTPGGDAAVVWNEYGSVGQVWGSILSGSTPPPPPPPPTAKLIKPVAGFETSNNVVAAWTSSGAHGPVTYDVRYRVAGYKSGFGGYAAWRTATAATSGTLTSPAGTVCFQVRARDDNGTGPWSSERCTGVAVDDRVASAKRFKNKSGNAYYLRTFRLAKAKGAKLTLKNVQAKSLGLLVAKGPGYGKIKVSFGGATVGTYSLASKKLRKRVVISLKTYPGVKAGTLIITSLKQGKPVVIDGFFARR